MRVLVKILFVGSLIFAVAAHCGLLPFGPRNPDRKPMSRWVLAPEEVSTFSVEPALPVRVVPHRKKVEKIEASSEALVPELSIPLEEFIPKYTPTNEVLEVLPIIALSAPINSRPQGVVDLRGGGYRPPGKGTYILPEPGLAMVVFGGALAVLRRPRKLR
jgi:hypothetical protein